jgi:probable HAF family extracellular repeat protein
MSDILVRCRHCGALKSPHERCACQRGRPRRQASHVSASRKGVEAALSYLTGGKGLTGVLAGMPQSVRYGLAGLGLIAAALVSLGIPALQHQPEEAPQPAIAASVPGRTVVLDAAPSRGKAPVLGSVRLPNGTTAQVSWTGEDATAAEPGPAGAPSDASLAEPAGPAEVLGGGTPQRPRRVPGFDATELAAKSPGGPVDWETLAPHPQKPIEPRKPQSPTDAPARAQGGQQPDAASSGKPAASARLVDLGTLGGGESVACDVNEAGQVVGKSLTATGEWHAFLWQNGQMQDLGTLGGESCAYAINENGQAAGYSYVQGNSGECRAVRWSADGTLATLGRLRDWPQYRGSAIAPSGTVVGWGSGDDGSQSVPLLWLNTKAVALPADGGAAYDLNKEGEIAGYAAGEGRRTAVTWRVGLKPKALQGLGEGWSEARAINERGHVVGFRQPEGDRARAFLYREGELTDLGTLGDCTMSVAQGINDSDEVVGYAWTGKDNARRECAFLWRDGKMFNLSAVVGSDAHLDRARRINNQGWIVASATLNGKSHACLIGL